MKVLSKSQERSFRIHKNSPLLCRKIKRKQPIVFVSLYCDRNMRDAILTGKIPEKLGYLSSPTGTFPVEMTSSRFLSQNRDNQTIVVRQLFAINY